MVAPEVHGQLTVRTPPACWLLISKHMRIAFMGATELGWNACRTLFDTGQEVVGIFSIPQQFRISWSPTPVTNVQYKSFEDLAAEHSIPLVYVEGKMSDPAYASALRSMRPEIIIVVGWYYILPRSLRELAPLGAAGLHASLLPKYRGGAPLVWATINGAPETGVTFFHFADGVDDGDIIGQARFAIDLEDDIASLLEKASQASAGLIAEYVPMLAAGTAPRIVQDHSQATSVPQRKPEDGLIDWHRLSARKAFDWVRAQTQPYPGAFTFLGTEKVTIWKSELSRAGNSGELAAGTIVRAAPDDFSVICAGGESLVIKQIGVAENARMSAAEFAASRGLKTGMTFTQPGTNCGSVVHE
jgi:methionyl-tRNA formyltransferase